MTLHAPGIIDLFTGDPYARLTWQLNRARQQLIVGRNAHDRHVTARAWVAIDKLLDAWLYVKASGR